MNRRSLLALALLAVAVALLAVQLPRIYANSAVWPPGDYVQYWCAGWLNLRGENPYDPVRMYELDKWIGWTPEDQPVMMWNPPWTLSVVMPLGFLPWRAAQFVWLLLKLAALAFCADRLWRVYGGPPERAWVGWAVTFAFLPTLVSFKVGQISPLLLLGATLFLTLEGSGRRFLAGAACVLLAVKPHLAYLFWLAVAAEAVTKRRFGIVLGGIAGGVAASVWPVVENPAVFEQYVAAARNNPPDQWMSHTIGVLLRLAFGAEQFWLQFLPMAAGLAWFAYDWATHARNWVWSERLPWLLFVSFVTAPYGAWEYDLVLLLVPLIRQAARLTAGGGPWWPAAGLIAVNLGMLALNVAEVKSVWFTWVAPTLLVLSVLTEQRLPPRWAAT
jgi:hypothetical protein